MLLSRSLKLAVLGLAMLAGGCDRQSADKAQQGAQQGAQPNPAATSAAKGMLDRSHKGSALPELTLSDPAGRQLPLASLKGKPVLLNLWATWCAPCVAELPTLDRVAAERGAQLRVIAASQDMGEPAKVADFLGQRGLKHLEPWLDPKGDLAFKLSAPSLPMTILYDAEGREVWRYIGERDWTAADAAKLLAEAPGS